MTIRQSTTLAKVGRWALQALLIGGLGAGCSMEQGETADADSETANHGAALAPVHSERLADGAVLSFWSTGPGGPSAIELVGHEDLRVEDRMAEVSGATPIEVYETLHEGPTDPNVLEALAPMTGDWNQQADRERIASIVGRDALDLDLELGTGAELIDKTHGAAWFTANHCDQRVGTAMVECLSANGPTVQTQSHGFGGFGIGFKVDPWLFTAYNDHTGNSTFTMNWSGGVFLTTAVGPNIVAVRSVNTNGNQVWGRMTNVGQVGRMAARSGFLILH